MNRRTPFPAKLNEKDSQGKNLLHWAAENRNNQIVQILLKKGVDPTVKDEFGKTYEDYLVQALSQAYVPRA